MRWEYTAPAGKIFLADGKDTWLYTPEDHRAEKSSLKLSEDDRAPLAFLLGKLDFHKDFQSFETHTEGSDNWIAALPKSQNLPYTRVEFLTGADGQIRKVRVTNQDQSKLEFSFSNEQLNAPVAPSLFVFRPPAGVEIINVGADNGGDAK
jgi:outer membrane lipoprotein carrier protein